MNYRYVMLHDIHASRISRMLCIYDATNNREIPAQFYNQIGLKSMNQYLNYPYSFAPYDRTQIDMNNKPDC